MEHQEIIQEIIQAVKDCDENIDTSDLSKNAILTAGELSEFCEKNNLQIWWDNENQCIVARSI